MVEMPAHKMQFMLANLNSVARLPFNTLYEHEHIMEIGVWANLPLIRIVWHEATWK